VARILISKLGLDGHDVGVKVLAAAARDAGHEVVYLGIRQTAATVARAAIEEDVDLVAISMLSGAHLTLVPVLMTTLRDAGSDVPVLVGGLVPPADVDALHAAGVADVVASGTSGTRAVQRMEEIIAAQERSFDAVLDARPPRTPSGQLPGE
jgi:methylmalonyl-CoA mutase C-terminal domain/subunit